LIFREKKENQKHESLHGIVDIGFIILLVMGSLNLTFIDGMLFSNRRLPIG